MKYLNIALFTLFITFNAFAIDHEETVQEFHESMVERSPHYYQNSTVHLTEEAPAEIQQLMAYYYVGLFNFALSLNLFEKGFEYQLNDVVHEVIDTEGLIIAYTFSIIIYKDNVISSIGMYEAHRRIDGVFYLSRNPAWY